MGRFDEMVKKAESCVSHNNKTGKCSRDGYAPIDCMICKSYIKREETEPLPEPYKEGEKE